MFFCMPSYLYGNMTAFIMHFKLQNYGYLILKMNYDLHFRELMLSLD